MTSAPFKIGALGDAAVLEVLEGDWTMIGGQDHTIPVTKAVIPVMTALGWPAMDRRRRR